MNRQQVFFVGLPEEVAHHAAPLASRREVRVLPPDEVAAQAEPGDLAIVTTEHFDRFRDCVRTLQRNSVATLYMIDGILEWRNAWENRPDEPACPFTMRPALADKVACIGPSQARVLEHWGNAGKIEIVGIPRMDALGATQPTDPPNDGPWRVLVMTAKCPAFTPGQRETVQRALADVRDWFHRHPTIAGRPVQVIWRLTAGLDAAIEVENSTSDLTGRELAAQVRSCHAVITTPSTGMLESMLLGRPTAVLDYTHSPAYVPAAWSIFCREHVADVIPDLLVPCPRRMLFQRHSLADALQLDEPATDRLERLVEAMLQGAREAIESGQPVRFPQPLLAPPKRAVGEFDHQALYPDFPEFAERDVRVLQTEWAHARREIAHLQSRIDQLESELGQAHEIFDQIRRHPIAGPIVRARESMMKLLARLKPFAKIGDEPEAVDGDGDAPNESAPPRSRVGKPR